MAGQQFFDVLAMGSIGTKGPTNAVRIAADSAGNLKASIKGGPYGPLGGASFGSDTILQLPNNVTTLVNALELILSMPPTAPGTELAQWLAKILINGVQTPAFSVGSSSGLPAIFIGDPANGDGVRANGAHNLQFLAGGSTFFSVDFSFGVEFFIDTRMVGRRFEQAAAGNTAIATTITLPVTGNMFPLTLGTGTLNSIVATGWQAGMEGQLILPSTATVTHNVAGTGATIMTSTGASIVAGAQGRAVWICYNGTNWFAQG